MPVERDPGAVRVAIFARVSTDKQDAHAQLNRLKAYAEGRPGWVVAHGGYDVASSRHTERLANRQIILQLARGHQFSVVLVEALDRWGRSVRDLVETIGVLRDAGASLHVASTGMVFGRKGDAQADFLFHVLSAVAELERSMISERTRRWAQSRRARGLPMGSPPRPCSDCGGPRPARLRGVRSGRQVPLCASCKAKPPSTKGGRPRKGTGAPKQPSSDHAPTRQGVSA